MRNRFYDYKNHCLKDAEITKALRKAADNYENGELSETQDICYEIAQAIQDFQLTEISNQEKKSEILIDINELLRTSK